MAVLAPPLVRPSPAKTISAPNTPSKTARPVPIQRRTTLKRSIDETEVMQFPSSPSKRSRVTFDSDVEILSADEDDTLDPALVKEHVRRAIERHRMHDDESYEKIKSVFKTNYALDGAPSTATLRVHLRAVLAHVTSLGRDCHGLVNAVLQSEFIGRDDSYYALFVRFLSNLAAAQRGYQSRIIDMLVDMLGPQRTRRVKDCPPVRQTTIHRRVQQAIQHIIASVPSSISALAHAIGERMNFEFAKVDERMIYIRSFMDMIDFVPEVTSDILVTIMRELVKLDVTIQLELDEEEDDDMEDELMQHMSASHLLLADGPEQPLPDNSDSEEDDQGYESISEDSDDEAVPANAVEVRRQKLKDHIKQVDLIMDILFRYYTKLTTSTTLSIRHNAIEQMISHFHSLILPTYRARHPQFLIFHFAQMDPIIVDRFVTSCVAVLVDKRQSQLLRHSAAAYFSGFVGRGAHVTPSVVRDCLELLCDQLTMLRKSYDPLCRGPDLKRFGDFYAAFQAILYIFCFRWRDIASPSPNFPDDSDSESDMDDEGMNNPMKQGPIQWHFPDRMTDALRAAIYSPLNPLRVCTPVIVDQFARLTYAIRLFYLFPKLDENKHIRPAPSSGVGLTPSPITSGTSTPNMIQLGGLSRASSFQFVAPERDMSWLGSDGMLEGYFPYDPYHLPVSRRWIENDYVEWQGVPGDVPVDADSSSGDEGGMDLGSDDEDDEDEGMQSDESDEHDH